MDPKGMLSSHCVPSMVIMPHLSKHKSDADHWFSRPFYTAPEGYKLCLRVDAHGYGDGAGTHVSVFVYLMEGENDYLLQWPFEYTVTFQILNWKKDANHMIYTIPFKDATAQANARVTSGEQAPAGIGQPKALPHTLLFDCKDKEIAYLHQDCLCVQVLKVDPPE